MYSFKVWGAGHSNKRVITPETVALVERWELFVDHWYEDGFRADKTILWSSMFGHAEGGDNAPFKMTPDERFTIEQARAVLAKDIAVKARWVDARITRLDVPLTTFMYGALISLTFQFGQGRLDKAQTGELPERPGEKFPFVQALNEGRYVKAFTIIRDLNFKKNGEVHDGLTLRRCTEIGYAMTKIE